MTAPSRRITTILAGLATVGLAVALGSVLRPVGEAGAQTPPATPTPVSPHTTAGTVTTDTCAGCHRTHTGQNKELLKTAAPQSSLCFTCHGGPGAQGLGAISNVQQEYAALESHLPTPIRNDPANNAYYMHAATVAGSNHTTAMDSSEFYRNLNRHSECSDCHNSHAANPALDAARTFPGNENQPWAPSGALAAISGVDVAGNWKNPITLEYELCLKCHSDYTTLPTTPPTNLSWKALDKVRELAAQLLGSGSYHPIAKDGTNKTPAMTVSLLGGTRYDSLTVDSTIRCTQCHSNSAGAGSGAIDSATTARLAPHASQYRGILAAKYLDRNLANGGYQASDFALCFLCHSSAPFGSGEESPTEATNFVKGSSENLHGKHVSDLGTGAGDSIDSPISRKADAICAECHFRLHGTALSGGNAGLISFAPSVSAYNGSGPSWTRNSSGGSCTLTCHGTEHNAMAYGVSSGFRTAGTTSTTGSGTTFTTSTSPTTGKWSSDPTGASTSTDSAGPTPVPTPFPTPVASAPSGTWTGVSVPPPSGGH